MYNSRGDLVRLWSDFGPILVAEAKSTLYFTMSTLANIQASSMDDFGKPFSIIKKVAVPLFALDLCNTIHQTRSNP